MVTPLTPALSPLRGEGVAWCGLGPSMVFARGWGFRMVDAVNRHKGEGSIPVS